MIIREATFDDIPALSRLACHVYSTTFGPNGIFPDDMCFSEEELAEQLAKHKSEHAFEHAMRIHGDTFLIAEDDNQIIGYIGLRDACIDITKGTPPTYKDQATNGIYIHPEHHRSGIGQKLFDATLNQDRFKNADNIYMVVWEENKPSYNFFIKNGFKPVGEIDVYAGGKIVGQDLVMARPSKMK